MKASSASRSMLPLKGWMVAGWRPSAMTRSTASAPVNSTLARVVSKWVLLGTTLPGPPMTLKRIFSAARPWWVGMTCRKGKSSWTASRKRNQDGEPGVALVAALDARPLVAAHGARARVGEQVDEHVVGVEVEQVVARRLEGRRALLDGRQPDRLDGVDAEGLDDRLPAVHAGQHTAPCRRMSPAIGTVRYLDAETAIVDRRRSPPAHRAGAALGPPVRLPGGGVEPGESMVEAAVREALRGDGSRGAHRAARRARRVLARRPAHRLPLHLPGRARSAGQAVVATRSRTAACASSTIAGSRGTSGRR